MSTLLIRKGPSGFVSLIDRNMRLGSDAKTVLVYDVAILVVSQSRFVPEPFYIVFLLLAEIMNTVDTVACGIYGEYGGSNLEV
jgi:hypothetical protein